MYAIVPRSTGPRRSPFDVPGMDKGLSKTGDRGGNPRVKRKGISQDEEDHKSSTSRSPSSMERRALLFRRPAFSVRKPRSTVMTGRHWRRNPSAGRIRRPGSIDSPALGQTEIGGQHDRDNGSKAATIERIGLDDHYRPSVTGF